MNAEEEKKLLATLQELHNWPCEYMYKFVVEKGGNKVKEVTDLFPKANIQLRESRTGRYTSITIKKVFPSAEHVVDRYKEVAKIQGVIKL